MTILSLILTAIFFVLAFIHFYWVAGGKWGLEQSLPKTEEGERKFEPGKLATAIVGIGLLALGFYYLIQTDIIAYNLPVWWTNKLGIALPSLFLVRALGDFKYVGFFKKVRNTEFAKWDTMFFSPLCTFIAILGVLVE